MIYIYLLYYLLNPKWAIESYCSYKMLRANTSIYKEKYTVRIRIRKGRRGHRCYYFRSRV